MMMNSINSNLIQVNIKHPNIELIKGLFYEFSSFLKNINCILAG